MPRRERTILAACLFLGGLVALLILVLVLVLTRRGGNEAETMRQQLALALSQQAETVQRVERSLREQEQALGNMSQQVEALQANVRGKVSRAAWRERWLTSR